MTGSSLARPPGMPSTRVDERPSEREMNRSPVDHEAGTLMIPNSTTRRRLLLAGGAGLTIAASGCLGDGENSEVTEDPTVFSLIFPHNPDDVQLNPWGSQFPSESAGLFFEGLSTIDPTGDREPAGPIDRVAIDGETVRVEFSESYRWWNGEPLTARDRYVDERIQRVIEDLQEAPGSPVQAPDITEPNEPAPAVRGIELDTVELLDEYTLEYRFAAPYSEPILLDRVLGDHHTVAAWQFESTLERLEDAPTSEDRAEIVDELRDERISLETVMELGYGSSAYELTEVSVNRLIFERHSGHPVRDRLEIPRLWLPVSMDQQAAAMIEDGHIDGGMGPLEERAPNPAESLEQLTTYQTNVGVKLLVNWNNRHLANPRVRQAILAAVPIADVVELGRWGSPTDVPSGLTEPALEHWVDEAIRDELYRYPMEANREQAVAYLEDGGYTKTGDRWVTANDEPLALKLIAPTRPAWSSATQLLEDQLRRLDIEVEFVELDNTTFTADVYGGNFDLAPWWREGRPHRAFAIDDPNPMTYGWQLQNGERGTRYGKPLAGSRPEAPGVIDPEATDGELHLGELWTQISVGSDENARRSAIEAVVIWWNAAVPDLDLSTGMTGLWGNTVDFEWPSSTDPLHYRGDPSGRVELALLMAGAIRPKE